jgi:hypothetical protein
MVSWLLQSRKQSYLDILDFIKDDTGGLRETEQTNEESDDGESTAN